MFRPLQWLPRLLLQSLFLVLLITAAGCNREMSFEPPINIDPGTGLPGGGDMAVFAFTSTSGNCSDAKTEGIFKAGKELGGSGTIKIKVNVSKKGIWAMTVGPVNGMVFLGGGIFTATGTQEITLIGTGVPVAAGIFTFPLKAGNATCSVPVFVTPGGGTDPEPADPELTDSYYKIIIDGKVYEQRVTEENGYRPGSSKTSSADEVELTASIEFIPRAGDPLPKGTTKLEVTRGLYLNYRDITKTVFRASLAPGSYPIRKSFKDGNGVMISWMDADGEIWSTEFGTGDQTGSTFNIINITDLPNDYGTFYIMTKMQFNCKLYNSKTGAMKQISNGEIISFFGMI
jgi:hypothetical protein